MRFPKPEKVVRKRSTISKRNKNRKATSRQCDILAGQLVRSRGVCEAAGSVEGLKCSSVLQWAHIVSRRYRSVRWSMDNAFCMCSAHHLYYTWRPVEFDVFAADKIGADKLSELKSKALTAFDKNLERVYDELLIATRPAV